MTASMRVAALAPQRGDRRYDGYGPFRVMACADGYVMARRPHCMPMIFSLAEWRELDPRPLAERTDNAPEEAT
jgi:hypothetical protein